METPSMSALDREFQDYFSALDRAQGADRCYICRRTASEVKAFFGFDEDGSPTEAENYGLEDVVLKRTDIMSYRGERPVCAVCQLNFDAIFLLGEHGTLRTVIREMEEQRERLWPEVDPGRDAGSGPKGTPGTGR